MTQGSLSHDLTQLIFSGLTKYDPKTQSIVGDLADYTVNSDGTEYSFVIKEGAKWHDGEPVTADDILFTYNTLIKDPDFHGAILNYNDYSGIKIIKADERTVQFLLEKVDYFFLTKTITGILPKHLLENESPSLLTSSPFNYNPIGSGPYRYVSTNSFADHNEINLEIFENYYGEKPYIRNVIFKIYEDYKALFRHTSSFDVIRNVPKEYLEQINKKKFDIHRYSLPQYVAVFMNTESPILKNKNIRLALQLGTDKNAIADYTGEKQIIDTPLLEIDQENWVNQFSINKANGALFETDWKIPNKEALALPEENNEEEGGNYITSPNNGRDFQTADSSITIAGEAPANTKAIIINDYELQKFIPGSKSWSYIAKTDFGNLKEGENLFEIYRIDFNGEKTLLDSITITYGTTEILKEEEKEKVATENENAIDLPTRTNQAGEKLSLKLITTKTPSIYPEIAKKLKEQWGKIGVEINIESYESADFYNALKNREYDLLIFGQNLGYNLDAYPYWHSSQAKAEGYNLSQFKNFVVDSLLEKVRYEGNEEERQKTLKEIQKVMSEEVPAIFLYSPDYYLSISKEIHNTYFDHLATHSDSVIYLPEWFIKKDYLLKEGVGISTFFSWIIHQF